MFHKIFLSFFLLSAAYCNEEVAKISEAMGHLIGKNLQSVGLEINVEALVKGMQDEASGKTSPLNEEQCLEAIASLQEAHFEKLAVKSLEEANAFLKKNQKKKGIVSLENGKLQYEVLQEGKGQTVQSYNSPLVHLTGHFLNGELIGDLEEVLTLEDSIPGFSKGILGMKEGEKRTLYIHPDLGYGKIGNFHPNALLIFEVEILKADASSEAHEASEREMLPVAPKNQELAG